MYKTTHQNSQRRTDHIRAAEIIQPVQITVGEEYENVRRVLAALNREIEALPNGPERGAKIRRQKELADRAKVLRDAIGVVRHKSCNDAFVTQAKLILAPAMFECILNAARTEWAEIEARRNQPSPEGSCDATTAD